MNPFAGPFSDRLQGRLDRRPWSAIQEEARRSAKAVGDPGELALCWLWSAKRRGAGFSGWCRNWPANRWLSAGGKRSSCSGRD